MARHLSPIWLAADLTAAKCSSFHPVPKGPCRSTIGPTGSGLIGGTNARLADVAPWALCPSTTAPHTVRERLSWTSVGMKYASWAGFATAR
jgi:hypothetical protein